MLFTTEHTKEIRGNISNAGESGQCLVRDVEDTVADSGFSLCGNKEVNPVEL